MTNDRWPFGMRTNDLLVARDLRPTTDVFLCYNISAILSAWSLGGGGGKEENSGEAGRTSSVEKSLNSCIFKTWIFRHSKANFNNLFFKVLISPVKKFFRP